MERLDKNFLWLSGANIAGTVFTALLMIYLARVLEATAFGYFSYAAAYIFYLFNFIDLGLSTYGIREIAKDRSRAREYASNIVSFKLIVASVIFIVFVMLAFIFCKSAVLRLIMIESALLLFIAALATEWAFQGMEKMHMVLISYSVTPLLQLGACLVLVRAPADVAKVPLILFICALPIIVTFLKTLGFRFHMDPADLGKIRAYLSSSLVIWGISVLAQAYNNLDIVLLGLFRPPADIGCFTIARRIVGGLTVLLLMLAGALLPRLSCTFGTDPAQFRRSTVKLLKISVMIALFVFMPVIIFSDNIISLTVGSEYLAASLPLKIMTISTLLVLFNLPFSTGLIAASHEKDVLKQASASAALSLILNLVLMPKYGMIGAAVAFFCAESLALAWILTMYHKRIRIVG